MQAMLNRVSFLELEEAKIDREIEKTRRRAADLLERQAQKSGDEDITSTVKDVLTIVAKQSSSQGQGGEENLWMTIRA